MNILVSLGNIRPFIEPCNGEYAILGTNKPQEGQNLNQRIVKINFSEESYYLTRVLRGIKRLTKTKDNLKITITTIFPPAI